MIPVMKGFWEQKPVVCLTASSNEAGAITPDRPQRVCFGSATGSLSGSWVKATRYLVLECPLSIIVLPTIFVPISNLYRKGIHQGPGDQEVNPDRARSKHLQYSRADHNLFSGSIP